MKHEIKLSDYRNSFTWKNQFKRFIWNILWRSTTFIFPRSLGGGWKRFILRVFGANINSTAVIYSSVTIFDPKNLVMEEYSCLASGVDCYNVNIVKIGAYSTISQNTYLCTASHDITKSSNPLVTASIIIEDQAWVAAGAFVGMGVTVHQGAVVGARAAVFKDVEPWTVVGGNPAKFIKKRIIKN